MTSIPTNAIEEAKFHAGVKFGMKYSLTPSSVKELSKSSTVDTVLQTAVSDEICKIENREASPTIAVMKDAFGEEMVQEWMFRNIELFIEMLGMKKQDVPEVQKTFISSMLIDKFSKGSDKLNALEILLFFYRALQGDYGKFFGTIDTPTIGEMAEKYLNWRYEEQTRLEVRQWKRIKDLKNEEMMKCPPPTKEMLDELHKTMEVFGKSKRVKRDEQGNIKFAKETPEEAALRNEHNAQFYAMLTQEQREQLGIKL